MTRKEWSRSRCGSVTEVFDHMLGLGAVFDRYPWAYGDKFYARYALGLRR